MPLATSSSVSSVGFPWPCSSLLIAACWNPRDLRELGLGDSRGATCAPKRLSECLSRLELFSKGRLLVPDAADLLKKEVVMGGAALRGGDERGQVVLRKVARFERFLEVFAVGGNRPAEGPEPDGGTLDEPLPTGEVAVKRKRHVVFARPFGNLQREVLAARLVAQPAAGAPCAHERVIDRENAHRRSTSPR